MKLIERLRGTQVERASSVSMGDWAQMFSFNGTNYQFPVQQSWGAGSANETIGSDFVGLVSGAYHANGVVFAVEAARLGLFTEGRFTFRRRTNHGRPGDIFGTQDLALLENPWPSGNTADLLARMLQDADFAGNAFVARRVVDRRETLRRLRPDGVTIVKGSKTGKAIDTEVVGYIYRDPRGGDEEVLLPEEVAHFAPTPDPLADYRGMSWLTPVVREIQGDVAMREHKIKFLENAATPNLVVTFDASVGQEAANSFIDRFEEQHAGYLNAYKTLFMGMGADVKSVGANMQQLDFAVLQRAGENRITMAGGVPAIIVGTESGLAHAAYANYFLAMRRFADGTMRTLWRNAAASLSHLINVPAGCELWIDDRDIAWLRQDQQDAAAIQQVKAQTIGQYIKDGFVPDSAVAAVEAGDPTLLEHSGLVSVQLQPPGTTADGVVLDEAPLDSEKPSAGA